MKIKSIGLFFSAVFLTLCCAKAAMADDVPAALTAIIPAIKKMGEDPALVKAVKEQNAKGFTLDQIQKRDKEWMAATSVDEQMSAMMKSAAAQVLAKYQASKPYFLECFLMDNLGANVAMTNKTSDYWQGDEDKFVKSYNNGAGGIDIGKSKFDESSKAYLIQVSVPVIDAGKAIGAITIGVNLDELARVK